MNIKNTQKKPVIEPCIALSLRKANRVLTQMYDRDMASHGIKITQFAILRAVNFLGEATNRSLQNALVLDQTTLSRNLQPLLRDGYLETVAGQDKREKVITLTAAGKALFKSAVKDWRQTQTQLQDLLGAELTQQLLDVNDAVVALKDTHTS